MAHRIRTSPALRLGPAVALVLCAAGVAAEPGPGSGGAGRRFSSEDVSFFAKEVQPVLQAQCLRCHGGEAKVKGGLKLTSRDDILKGGDTGPAVSLDRPEGSLLLKAVNHADDLRMPPKGKLSQAQIDALTQWVRKGLPYPERKAEPAAHGPPRVDDKARSFWAFRPRSEERRVGKEGRSRGSPDH